MAGDENPLVSIFMPCYNQEKYIAEALEGALVQAHDYPNIEIVVGDDGSTDGTVEIIKEYARKYPRLIVPLVDQEHVGITKNCNRILKACRGKYIALTAGDDVLLPGKIAAQVKWMEEDENRVLCGHQVEVFYSDDSRPSYLFPPFQFQLKAGRGCRELIKHGIIFPVGSVMFRADRILNGFDERLDVVSDQLFLIDILRHDGEYGWVKGVLSRYRRHTSNITLDTEKCLRDAAVVYDILEEKYPEYKDAIDFGRAAVVEYQKAMGMIRSGKMIGIVRLLEIFSAYPQIAWFAVIRRLGRSYPIRKLSYLIRDFS